MKKHLIFIIICIIALPCFSQIGSKGMVVIGFEHADNVRVNGKPVAKDQSIDMNTTISWGNDDKAAILVKDKATSKTYVLSKRQSDSKGKVRTIADFFLRTNKTSTRETGDEAIVTVKRCSDRFAFKERRIALVIGNTTYTHLPPLINPQNDAVSMTDKLLTLGFDVVETFDCNISEFRSVLNQFERIADSYEIVLFYYAGHGIQKDGKNYLVPVTEQLRQPSDINNCVDCEDVLRSLERTKSRSRIVIFDACRNFNSALSDGHHKGLAQMQQLAPGTMVIFSTGFGQVASDGEGDHSPFAQALLGNIGQPNTSFEMEIKKVANETFRLTGNRQYPAISGTLTSSLVLNPNKNAERSSTTVNSNDPTPASNAKAQELVNQGKRACKSFKYTDAYKYFQEAANMEDREGCYQLGMLYHDDNFPNANLDKAIQWLTKAANMGHVDAMFQLGLIYQGRDNALAKQWLKKAADKGHSKAADRLSRMR